MVADDARLLIYLTLDEPRGGTYHDRQMSALDPKRASRIPAVTAGYDFNRGKELPIRERWLKDWERWT